MIIVLVGKTASGKTTVANELCKNHGYKRIITYTTRPMRENEVQDVDYHFISDEQFNKMVENNEFTEYKRYNTAHGVWSYGSVVTLEQEYSDDCYVIILTPQGLRDLSKKVSRYIAFYLNVDFKIQLERLKKRGDEEQQIIKRLKNDVKDFENVLDIVDYSFCTDIASPQRVANAISNFIFVKRVLNKKERNWLVNLIKPFYQKIDHLIDIEVMRHIKDDKIENDLNCIQISYTNRIFDSDNKPNGTETFRQTIELPNGSDICANMIADKEYSVTELNLGFDFQFES